MTTVEMTDVYRSLVANLKDKLGGTITEANADAIAHAAAQVYRREVEPRLWEEKSAHQLLDSLGVPRSGAFVPYSLSDRLLLLHGSDAERPYRAQAHELLDELAVPGVDDAGLELSLRARLTLLLGSLDGAAGTRARNGADAGDDASTGNRSDEDAGTGGDGDPDSQGNGQDALADGTPGPELVDALEAIQRAVRTEGEDASNAPPPPPPGEPGPDLIGLGTLLGRIQEELVEVRQSVESLREELRDAVALFHAGGLSSAVAPVPPAVAVAQAGDEIVVGRVGGAPEAAEPGAATPEAVDAASGTAVPSEIARGNGAPDAPVPPAPVGPHETTRVLPAVGGAPPPESAAGEEPVAGEPVAPRRRSRRFVLLVLLVVLIGAVLAAGITAAVVLGWDELQSRFVDTVGAPVPGVPAGTWW